MRVRAAFVAIAVAAGALATGPALAQSLNIDFSAHFGTPSNTFGAAAGQPGTWNTLGLGTTPTLAGLTGATSVSATVTADTGDGWAPNCAGDVDALVDDNFYSLNGTWTVALSGLANGTYTVYLYNPSNGAVVTGDMTVNGAPLAGITGHACTFTLGSNYLTTQVNVTAGTLTITGTSAGTANGFAGLSGMQLVFGAAGAAIPAASPWGLALLALAVAGIALIVLRRSLAS